MERLHFNFFFLTGVIILMLASCKKDSFNTSQNAFISTSSDTLHFDTVFTSVGSVTQLFKIFNLNDQKLRLSKIELAGGNASFFKINVNGLAGTSFTDIDIAPNDSIYVFVSVIINPNQSDLPFVVQDSILLSYNGNDNFIQLDAYGRNAHFLNNVVVTKDSSLTNELPFVILGGLTVNENVTLTVNQGTQIFAHQNAAIVINGTLKVNGEKNAAQQVQFSGDRLDDPYKFFPASWPGIIFTNTSKDNQLNSVVITNAITAISLDGTGDLTPQLILNGCIISNNSNEGIKAINTNVYAENCLITNCGLNNVSLNGGIYNFVYCTMACYSNILFSHQAPVLYVSDTIYNAQVTTLTATFTNDIFYGESGLFDDEIQLMQNGSSFNARFDNVLYKAQNLPQQLFDSSINGLDPNFFIVDVEHHDYDFHLAQGSPCIDAGKQIFVNDDLDGNLRNAGVSTDIGCYEAQ